jgi:small neutral amino acid transporter SnatA (MarC family)
MWRAGLTASLSRQERHLTALRAVIYATIILVAAGQGFQFLFARNNHLCAIAEAAKEFFAVLPA